MHLHISTNHPKENEMPLPRVAEDEDFFLQNLQKVDATQLT